MTPHDEQQHATAQDGTADSGTSGPPNVTQTKYEEQVNAIREAIGVIEANFPSFALPSTMGRSFNTPYLRIPERFVGDAMNALAAAPELGLGIIDPEIAHETQQRISAFFPVVERLKLLAAGAEFTVNTDRAMLGSAATKIYTAAATLARDPRSTIAAAHTKIMRISRGLLRKKKNEQTPSQLKEAA